MIHVYKLSGLGRPNPVWLKFGSPSDHCPSDIDKSDDHLIRVDKCLVLEDRIQSG